MCIIPLDLQKRFEQRWAARFCRPPPAAPQSQPQQQQLSEPAKAKGKTRRVKISAARHTAPAEGVPSLASALIKCRNG